MDERALTELLECSVCLEQLDATSKVLQCQHTFCRRCLEEIVATKNELRCPECRMLVEMRVEDLPSNILLIRLLEGLKNCKAGITGQSSSSANSSPSHTQPPSPGSAAGGIKTSPSHKLVNTSLPCAKALYNYEAKESGDLTFKKGDVILLRRQVDENWYHGELNNQHGFFPATYVQVITPLPQDVPKCKALYDFVISDKNEKDCLTFQKDEVLTVIRRVDDNWAEGKLGDRIGIFPISFVEMNDSAKWLINNQTQINARPDAVAVPSSSTAPASNQQTTSNNNISSSTDSSPQGSGSGNIMLAALSHPTVSAVQRTSGQKRHSLTCLTSHKVVPQNIQHRHSMEISGNLSLVPLIPDPSSTSSSTSSPSNHVITTSASSSTSKHQNLLAIAGTSSTPESHSGASTSTSQSGSSGLVLYVALYNYKPQKEDEVELRKGDYYTVAEKCQDGWFKGTCLRTGAFGVFPGNYVQLVRISSKQTSASVNRGAAPGAVSIGVPGTAAAAATSQNSPSRQVAKVQQHATVSRAHSFPKTSPLASMDYQVRQGQAGTRTANATPTHTSRAVPNPSQSRPITNPTVTPTRTASGAPRVSSAGIASSSSSTNTSPAHAQSRVHSAPLTNGSANGQSESRKSHHHGHSRSGGGNTNSPRSSRKSERSKHSGERGSKHCSMVASSGHRSHSVDAPPHTPTRTGHSGVPGATSLHSMAANASLTPPNVVVGAVGGGDAPPPPPAPREKEKEKKKDKDRLSLMKRLTKSKKSKSPPPDHASNGASSSEAGAAHQRYRCIVPYPPQSDIELELKIGDIVFVHRRREDGWYKGTLQRTSKTGLFPGSFVEAF